MIHFLFQSTLFLLKFILKVGINSIIKHHFYILSSAAAEPYNMHVKLLQQFFSINITIEYRYKNLRNNSEIARVRQVTEKNTFKILQLLLRNDS